MCVVFVCFDMFSVVCVCLVVGVVSLVVLVLVLVDSCVVMGNVGVSVCVCV